MNVLYYYYYLFYTRVLPDDEPHATTIFTLSFCQGLLVNCILDISMSHFFCRSQSKWEGISITLLIIVVNYFLYIRSGKAKEIVSYKPKILGSNTLSIIITIIFLLVSISYLFWGSFYTREILGNCN
jgi:hypothetical protein